MHTPTNSLKNVAALPLVFVSLCVLLLSITTVQAQTNGTTTGTNAAGATTASTGTPRVRRTPAARLRRGQQLRQGRKRTARAVAPSQSAVTLVGATTRDPDYLFGQARVAVKGNEDPIIRLGIAKHGPTVVEFPASDNFFAVHPGGSYLVTYDKSESLSTDHYLVFRAGEGFTAPPENSIKPLEPLASISVQMQSGMFVTFLFYPVGHVSRMAHRCVVSYSREEIVAARRAVGLAVNLDGKEPATAQPQVASTRASGTAENANNSATETTNATSTTEPGASVILAGGTQPEGATEQGREQKRKTQRRRSSNLDVVAEARRAIERALKTPAKFTTWSPVTQGLTVATLAPVELDERYRLAVVAVRNTSAAGLRLLPDQPDLDLETLDAASRIAQTRAVQKAHVETSSLAGAIPAGATVYYAIIYESPILDAQQRLRLSVAHRGAADRPASADLSAQASANR